MTQAKPRSASFEAYLALAPGELPEGLKHRCDFGAP
jgi:hypothetical protein